MIFEELEMDSGQFMVDEPLKKDHPLKADRDSNYEFVTRGNGYFEGKNGLRIFEMSKNDAPDSPPRRQTRAITHFSPASVLEARTSSGQTLLHVACANGHLEIVDFLLSKKADPTVTCSASRSCLRVALAGGYSEVVSRLLCESIVHDTLNKRDGQGFSLLSIASSEMGEVSVGLLLRAGADCTVRNRDLSTPITQAIKHNKYDNLSKLLSSDCAQKNMEYAMTYTKEGDFNSTALHLACERNFRDAAKLLLEHGADPNIRDKLGRTALHEASRLGMDEIVGALVNNRRPRMDLNALDEERGWSAFHYACCEGSDDDWPPKPDKNALRPEDKTEVIHCGSYYAVISHLVDADWFIPAGNGDYFMHLAAQKGNVNRLRFLLKEFKPDKEAILLYYLKGAGGHLPLERALLYEHAAVVELLTDRMFSIELDESFDRENLLMWLTKTPETRDVLSKVLSKELVAQGRRGFGPDLDALGWAAYSGSASLVWRLLQCSTPGQALECSIREAITAAHTAMRELETEDYYGKCPPEVNGTEETGAGDVSGEQEIRIENKRAIEVLSPTTAAEKTREKLRDILCILHNPPATSRPAVRDSALNQGPQFDADSQPSRFVKDLRVELVGCCKDSLLRRSVSVKDALYKEGPFSIMETEIKEIKKLHEQFGVIPGEQTGDGLSEGSAAPEIASEGLATSLKMLWIHLPANNVSYTYKIYVPHQHLFQATRVEKTPPPRGLKEVLMRDIQDACLKVNSELKLKNDEGNLQYLCTSWDEVIGNGLRTNLMKPLCTTRFDAGHPNCAAIYVQLQKIESVPLLIPYVAPAWRGHETDKNPDELVGHYRLKNHLIHGSRTLDEYFYHSCRWISMKRIMEARNCDQILTKSLEGGKMKPEKPAILVHVDQLWIWIPNKDVIITSATHRQDGECDPVFVAAFDALQKAIRTNGKMPSDAFEMAHFIMDACSNLFSRRFSMSSTRAQRSWSLSAGDGDDRRGDRQSRSDRVSGFGRRGLKREYTGPLEKQAPDLLSRVCIKEAFTAAIAEAVAMEIELYEWFIEQQRGASQHSAARGGHNPLLPDDRTLAARLFREIKDIRDELKILRIVAESQRSVQREFRDLVGLELQKIGDKDVVDELHDLDKAVEQIETSVSITLNLQQNATSIAQTDVAVYHGQIILVFTVATIIFLPMSFFASLFALQVDSFLNTPRWAFGVLCKSAHSHPSPRLVLSLIQNGVVGASSIISISLVFGGPDSFAVKPQEVIRHKKRIFFSHSHKHFGTAQLRGTGRRRWRLACTIPLLLAAACQAGGLCSRLAAVKPHADVPAANGSGFSQCSSLAVGACCAAVARGSLATARWRPALDFTAAEYIWLARRDAHYTGLPGNWIRADEAWKWQVPVIGV
ncbi:ankyrin repeat [Cordyceps militaris]|uniref:Ankyrin repeat n=1 Tax=Cordyceps militaris TaxID=73501 RepID=A0A2H4SAH3_CORMI|nr:ankyrin repeat [Cordyceps militaris]